MPGRLVPSRSLFVSVALLVAGNGLLSIFLSVRMTLAQFSTPIIGVVMAAYFAGLVTGATRADRILRRVGHIRAFAAFASVLTSAVLMHGLLVSAPAWAVLRAVTGFSMAGLYMVIESWLNAHATNESRGRLFSLYMIISIFALGVGQFLLNLGDPRTLQPILLAAVLFAACALPVSLTRSAHPAVPEYQRYGLRELFRTAPIGVAGAFGAGLTGGAFVALGPVYGVRIDLGVPGISALMGLTVLGGLALQWPVGAVSDRIDRRRMLAVVSLLLAAASVAIALTDGRSLGGLLGLAAVFGGPVYLLYPLSVSHANDRIDSRLFVQASASLLFVWGFGSALGPLLASQVMGAVGPAGLFYYLAAVSTVLGVFAWARRRESVPTEEQTPFVALARTTPVIAELDPRAEGDS